MDEILNLTELVSEGFSLLLLYDNKTLENVNIQHVPCVCSENDRGRHIKIGKQILDGMTACLGIMYPLVFLSVKCH